MEGGGEKISQGNVNLDNARSGEVGSEILKHGFPNGAKEDHLTVKNTSSRGGENSSRLMTGTS